MSKEKIIRVAVSVAFALILLVLIVVVGIRLGIPEDQRVALVSGGLFASLIFGLCVGKTYFSCVGMAFFSVTILLGWFAKLTPAITLFLATFVCLIVAIFFAWMALFELVRMRQ